MERMASKIGIYVTVLQIWFKNFRAKLKKTNNIFSKSNKKLKITIT